MNLEISPQPSEAERKAILAAFEIEEAERETSSAWADALLPQREAEDPDRA